MQRFGVPATVRVSLSLHNTFADIDALIDALEVAWARLR
jgi:selenocysteine lyase/cysteine desulfurase